MRSWKTTIHFHQTLLTNVSDQTYSHFGQQPAILLPQLRQIASFPRIRGYSKTGSAAPITRLETICVSQSMRSFVGGGIWTTARSCTPNATIALAVH
jgi:hypothetical protein